MADVVEQLNEYHKVRYAKQDKDLIPNIAKIQQDIAFSSAEKIGDEYQQPVRLALPGGFTTAAGDGTAGAFTLNDSKAGTTKKAKIKGFQVLLRDQMSYEDASKAAGSEQSYVQAMPFFFQGLKKSMRKRLESYLLYGGTGIGKIGAYTAGDPSITIATAEWAAQLWAATEGSEIDIMSGATATVRGTVTITRVDIENKKVYLSTTVTGAAANDVIYFKGGYATEMLGIHGILNTSGSLFGIDNSIYSLWKPTSHAVTGQLSFGAVKKAIAKAVNKGLDEDIVLYTNPGGWDDMASDIAALRTITKDEIKKVEIGSESIVYFSQNGKTEIKAHPMVKEGYAYGLCLPYFKRVGSTDVVLGAPGFEGAPWFHLQNKAGVEARTYTNQAIYSEAPAMSFVISGIVNSVV